MAQQSAQQTVRDRLFAVAMEKGLRQSTVLSYERLLGRLGILDEVEVSQENVLSRLWTIDNPNTRQACRDRAHSARLRVRSALTLRRCVGNRPDSRLPPPRKHLGWSGRR